MPDPFSQRMGIGLSVTQFLEIRVVGIVAAEPLPSEIGGAHIVDMLIGRGRAPVGCIGCHGDPPLAFELIGEERIPDGAALRKLDDRQWVMPERHQGYQCFEVINSR